MIRSNTISVRRETLRELYFLLKEIHNAQSRKIGLRPSVPVSKTDVDKNLERVSNLLGFPPDQKPKL